MSLIKSAAELEIQPTIKALIYGMAGIGKSTISLSAPKPLLFDFDNGVHRVNFNHLDGVDTVQIKSYDDMITVLDTENLKSYETFVIDTGGKLLDYMGEYIIKRNSKMGRSNGMLTLQGYGERKAMFKALCSRISLMGKHIIFVAHRETRQEDDDQVRYVPLFGGSNYDSLVTELDIVGYMEANGRKRTITFDPTSRNDGKNTCNLPPIVEVPTILDENGNPTAENNFIKDFIIEPYKNRIQIVKAEAEKFNNIMSEIDEQIELITDAQSANDFVSRIDSFEHVGTSKVLAGKKLYTKTKKLGLKFNKEKNEYEKE